MSKLKAFLVKIAPLVLRVASSANAAAIATLRWLVGLGASFWFFNIGVACVGIGAFRISVSLGWMLIGLLLIWDVTRASTPPPPPPRR